MIAVTFPCHPDLYPMSQQYSWAQISHFVFKALVKAFPKEDVRFFNSSDEIPLSGRDILVSNVTDHTKRWKRSVIVDNDNLEDDKWLKGRFTKYGMDHVTDCTVWTKPHMEDVLAIFLKTNDVALRKWHADDHTVSQKKAWLLGACPAVHVLPHPIDKAYFGSRALWNFDLKHKFKKAKMLVFFAGQRKNAKELIELLVKLGYDNRNFTVTDQISKSFENVEKILSEYMLFGHVSVSEGFPYLASEFMCQGMMLYGNEEWWDGYGDNRVTWTYDPARMEENADKLKFLFDPANLEELHAMRVRLWTAHMTRKDNDWSYFTNLIVKEIEKHL